MRHRMRKAASAARRDVHGITAGLRWVFMGDHQASRRGRVIPTTALSRPVTPIARPAQTNSATRRRRAYGLYPPFP